jgi:hypothetical protein
MHAGPRTVCPRSVKGITRMSIDETTGWDCHAAIRHAVARLECLPDAEQWSHVAPADGFSVSVSVR